MSSEEGAEWTPASESSPRPRRSQKRLARLRKAGRAAQMGKAGNADTEDQSAPAWRQIAKGVYYGGGGAYLYQPILKCGCTTVKTLLLELEGLPVDEHLWRRHRKEFNKFPGLEGLSKSDGMDVLQGRTQTFKFVIVRNPYARLASAYKDKIAGKTKGTHWIRLIRKSAEKYGVPLGEKISFEEFVKVVSRQQIREMDPHWRPQYYAGRFKAIKFDFIGHMEMMASDLVFIGERIGAPPSFIARVLAEKYNTTGSSLDMWKAVSEEARQAYLSTFAIDFDFLHYPRQLAV